MKYIACYLIGLLFGLGIIISGMGNPAKVINFFDIAGTWDPSLALVMGGALLTSLIGYRLVFKKQAPLFDSLFHLPDSTALDKQLISGSVLFGVGWGIAGFCPGGALPVVGTGNSGVLLFVLALCIGIIGTRHLLNST